MSATPGFKETQLSRAGAALGAFDAELCAKTRIQNTTCFQWNAGIQGPYPH